MPQRLAQGYLADCGNLANITLAASIPKGSGRDAAGQCRHTEFGCFLAGLQGQTCRAECPVGTIFAQYSLLMESIAAGAIDDARILAESVLYLRVLVPPACGGSKGEKGCWPLLPVGWYAGVVDQFVEATDFLAMRQLSAVTPQQRRLAAGRDIAVVTAYHTRPGIWRLGNEEVVGSGQTEASPEAPMYWYLENKRCYAERHGYRFVFDRRAPAIDLAAEADGYSFVIHWVKLMAVRSALQSHDWVFWIDYDALFANFSQTLEEFIDKVESHSAADIILQNGFELVSPNAFLIRNSPWSFRFLEKWEAFGRQVVHGRSKMWELRTFNCALVHMLLASSMGSGIKACSEWPDHLFLMRRLLEKYGAGYQERRKLRAMGKVYFWDPVKQWPRGFLFNVNDEAQQAHFNEEDLYHVGDLGIHWPKPNKDTPVMRAFANEIAAASGCARWNRPAVDLEEAFQPQGDLNGPALFSPEVLLRRAARTAQLHYAAVLATGPEGWAVLAPLLAAGAAWQKVDLLLGSDGLPREAAGQQTAVVRVRQYSSIGQLPVTAFYDFIYVGMPSRAKPAEVGAEVREALRRLVPGGLLVIPPDSCGRASGARYEFSPLWWRTTRTPGSAGLGGYGRGCIWAYRMRNINADDYFFAVTGKDYDASQRKGAA